MIKRSNKNPILKPKKDQSWEANAVFNACPVKKGSDTYIFYRALSLQQYYVFAQTKMALSSIGIAKSKDGIDFCDRRKIIFPEKEWEKFGCEDPRVTKFNNKYYIFYTALSNYPFNADGIKVGLAISNDLKSIKEKHLVTPFNAKGMALFPEKIKGKIWAILTVHTDMPPAKICLAEFDKEKQIWSESYWNKWHKNFSKNALPLERDKKDHVEVGAPPIKTKYGWLLIYSYIKGYFSPQRVFTVEAVLLDLKNPSKIIARTDAPILTPEEYYEREGLVPNIVFPSGALIKGDSINFYYGAADTTCCLAFLDLSCLLDHMVKKEKRTVKLLRAKENPIISPNGKNSWESKATFNPAALHLDNKVHIVYRAMSEDNTSVLGYASCGQDGIKIEERLKEPIYIPREPFEQKLVSGGNSGCEDPRLTKIGNKIYMCYTAFNGKDLPRVALTWIKEKDFLLQRWNWAKPVLISNPHLDNKDAFIFPEKVNGKYMIVHRYGIDIDITFCSSLNFKNDEWLGENRWLVPRKGWWDSKKVGAATPPVKTKDGWVLLYHGISDDNTYRVGAVLLDIKDPVKIIGRTDSPILEPETSYEKEGVVPNVVFPCGTALLNSTLFVYYGGGDKVICVSTVEIKKLLKILKQCLY